MRRPILFAITAAALTVPLAALAKPPPTRSGSEPIFFTVTLENQAGSGHEEQIDVHAVTWGPRNAPLRGWAKADGLDVTWDVPESRSTAARGHSMLGASDKVTVGGSQTESAQATGKRQHMPLRSRMYYDTPQGTGPGTLVVKGSLPGCTVGKRYAGMQFASSNKRYQLNDVVISNCSPGVVELRYAKVTVRGWDPEKKEE